MKIWETSSQSYVHITFWRTLQHMRREIILGCLFTRQAAWQSAYTYAAPVRLTSVLSRCDPSSTWRLAHELRVVTRLDNAVRQKHPVRPVVTQMLPKRAWKAPTFLVAEISDLSERVEHVNLIWQTINRIRLFHRPPALQPVRGLLRISLRRVKL